MCPCGGTLPSDNAFQLQSPLRSTLAQCKPLARGLAPLLAGTKLQPPPSPPAPWHAALLLCWSKGGCRALATATLLLPGPYSRGCLTLLICVCGGTQPFTRGAHSGEGSPLRSGSKERGEGPSLTSTTASPLRNELLSFHKPPSL